jgi:hypothetical protein
MEKRPVATWRWSTSGFGGVASWRLGSSEDLAFKKSNPKTLTNPATYAEEKTKIVVEKETIAVVEPRR